MRAFIINIVGNICSHTHTNLFILFKLYHLNSYPLIVILIVVVILCVARLYNMKIIINCEILSLSINDHCLHKKGVMYMVNASHIHIYTNSCHLMKTINNYLAHTHIRNEY